MGEKLKIAPTFDSATGILWCGIPLVEALQDNPVFGTGNGGFHFEAKGDSLPYDAAGSIGQVVVSGSVFLKQPKAKKGSAAAGASVADTAAAVLQALAKLGLTPDAIAALGAQRAAAVVGAPVPAAAVVSIPPGMGGREVEAAREAVGALVSVGMVEAAPAAGVEVEGPGAGAADPGTGSQDGAGDTLSQGTGPEPGVEEIEAHGALVEA